METFIPAIPLTRTQRGVFTLASIVKLDQIQEKRCSGEYLTRIYDILLRAERTWYMYSFLQTDNLVSVFSIFSRQNGGGGYVGLCREICFMKLLKTVSRQLLNKRCFRDP